MNSLTRHCYLMWANNQLREGEIINGCVVSSRLSGNCI
ncbi:unnamed protein product [Brassica oleracea var. botrytis]